MTDHLSAADRSALVAEKSAAITMAVGEVIVTRRGAGVTVDAMQARIAARLDLLPRLRQKVYEPPLGLAQVGVGRAEWVEDESFDLDWHVRPAALRTGADDDDLALFVGREFSRRMDRTRPLWEVHVLEEMAGDRAALVIKLHHALVDGMSALGMLTALLDASAEVTLPSSAGAPGAKGGAAHTTTGTDTLVGRLSGLASRQVSTARSLAAEAVGRARDTSALLAQGQLLSPADLRRATEVAATLVRSRPPAPALPFNRPISGNRSFASVSAPLEDMKVAARAAGGKLNDLVLAAVSGMLDSYLLSQGIVSADLPRDPVVLVPVSTRRDGDPEGGNRISVVFVDLPVGEPDPAARVRILSERMARIKNSADVRAGELMVDASAFIAPMLASQVASMVGGGDGGPACNLVVSNMPGPRTPLYVNGAEVLSLRVVVPLNPANQGLNVGVLSYNGTVSFSISADKRLDPLAATAAAGLRETLDALLTIT